MKGSAIIGGNLCYCRNGFTHAAGGLCLGINCKMGTEQCQYEVGNGFFIIFNFKNDRKTINYGTVSIHLYMPLACQSQRLFCCSPTRLTLQHHIGAFGSLSLYGSTHHLGTFMGYHAPLNSPIGPAIRVNAFFRIYFNSSLHRKKHKETNWNCCLFYLTHNRILMRYRKFIFTFGKIKT